MPLWMRLNLRQKAVYEVLQAPPAEGLPHVLAGDELDFFIRGLALSPHWSTYLPQLVDRGESPLVVDEGLVPGVSSRRLRLRFRGPDPLASAEGEERSGVTTAADGSLEVHVGWRWLFAFWRGPLVDEVQYAGERPLWPEVARSDWSWEDDIGFCPPPYHVTEEGLPWREGLDAGFLGVGLQAPRITRGIRGVSLTLNQPAVAAASAAAEVSDWEKPEDAAESCAGPSGPSGPGGPAAPKSAFEVVD